MIKLLILVSKLRLKYHKQLAKQNPILNRMGLFNKLKSMNTNNSKLLDLIATYYKQEGKDNSYMNVIQELMNGNSTLLLPSANDTPEEQKALTEAGHTKTLRLSSVFNHD